MASNKKSHASGNLCSEKKINPGEKKLTGYTSGSSEPKGSQLAGMQMNKGGRWGGNSASSVKGK